MQGASRIAFERQAGKTQAIALGVAQHQALQLPLGIGLYLYAAACVVRYFLRNSILVDEAQRLPILHAQAFKQAGIAVVFTHDVGAIKGKVGVMGIGLGSQMLNRFDDLADLCQIFSIAGIGLRYGVGAACARHQQSGTQGNGDTGVAVAKGDEG